jgi:hypothetical protein
MGDPAASGDVLSDVATSRVEMNHVEDGKPLFVGKGMLDFVHDRGLLSMSSGPGGPALPGGRMQVRIMGQTGYTGWTFSGGTRWVKDVDTTPRGSDRFIPGLGGPGLQDLLDVLTKSSNKIDKLEREEVRGVSTTHYRARFDSKKLDEYLPKGADPVVEAWIDDAGVVRRVSVPDADGVTVVEYFDFGVDFDVEAPPADEIVSEEEFSKLIVKWCKEQPKDRNNLFCNGIAGEGSSGGEPEPGPIETVEK